MSLRPDFTMVWIMLSWTLCDSTLAILWIKSTFSNKTLFFHIPLQCTPNAFLGIEFSLSFMTFIRFLLSDWNITLVLSSVKARSMETFIAMASAAVGSLSPWTLEECSPMIWPLSLHIDSSRLRNPSSTRHASMLIVTHSQFGFPQVLLRSFTFFAWYVSGL